MTVGDRIGDISLLGDISNGEFIQSCDARMNEIEQTRNYRNLEKFNLAFLTRISKNPEFQFYRNFEFFRKLKPRIGPRSNKNWKWRTLQSEDPCFKVDTNQNLPQARKLSNFISFFFVLTSTWVVYLVVSWNIKTENSMLV